jgi:hypothetical protein
VIENSVVRLCVFVSPNLHSLARIWPRGFTS